MSNDSTRYAFTYDSDLLLKDAGLVAASAAGKVGGTAKLIDVGLGAFEGALVIDASAIEVGTGDELFTITVQGAQRDTTSTRSAPVIESGTLQNLASLTLGHTAVQPGGGITSVAGRYMLFFRNVQADIVCPILRVYTTVAGTIATGINFTAFVGKVPY